MYVLLSTIKRVDMRYLIPMILLVVLFTGCQKARIDDLERRNKSLQQQYDTATVALATQSQYIDDVTNAINSVYGNLQRISDGETMLSKTQKEMEIGKGAMKVQLRERIINQIAGIDTYLVANRKKIDDLEAKLKKSQGKYAGLEKMVTTLKQAIADKEHSIALLEDKLKSSDIQIKTLEVRLSQKEDTAHVQEDVITTQKKEINKAYYIIGTAEDLQSRGIISREGGFPFGLFGRTTVLASGFDKTDFVTIDRYEQTTIDITGKVDEIVPKRKENYYTLTQDATTTKLLVLDPDKFWQDSYLVIITK